MSAELRYLEARAADDRPAQVVIQGAPFEGGVSWRGGATEGPRETRIASDSIESYSPRTGRDLLDIDLADAGDLDCKGLDSERALALIERATTEHARAGALVVTLGGDHSVSIGTSRGLRAVYPDLIHLVFDAHMDMRESYDDNPLSHATGTRHMASAGPTCLLGVRSGARQEWIDAQTMLQGALEDLEIPAAFAALMRERPVFVSVDLDVLDPSIFPGTGTPEPGGPTYRELRACLLGLAGARIVGLDLVEIAPPIDGSGLTPVVAAELLRDCVLAYLPA